MTLPAWLNDLIARVLAAFVEAWRRDNALRDQGAAAAAEAARLREAAREEAARHAAEVRRTILADADDDALGRMLRERFGPGRR